LISSDWPSWTAGEGTPTFLGGHESFDDQYQADLALEGHLLRGCRGRFRSMLAPRPSRRAVNQTTSGSEQLPQNLGDVGLPGRCVAVSATELLSIISSLAPFVPAFRRSTPFRG
jgi:hypothetical protein